jgi:hypothetical protein
MRIVKAIPVPAQTASLSIPVKSLYELPPGAVFTAKEGRASVSAGIYGDTIRIYALCDSLQTLVEYYEAEIIRIRGDTETKSFAETETVTSTDILSPIKLLLAGFAAGVLFTGIFSTIIIIRIKT